MHNVPRNNLINIQIADDVFNIDSDKSFASVKLRFKFRDGDELKISAKRNYINVIEQTENVFRLKEKKKSCSYFRGDNINNYVGQQQSKISSCKNNVLHEDSVSPLLSSKKSSKPVSNEFRNRNGISRRNELARGLTFRLVSWKTVGVS